MGRRISRIWKVGCTGPRCQPGMWTAGFNRVRCRSGIQKLNRNRRASMLKLSCNGAQCQSGIQRLNRNLRRRASNQIRRASMLKGRAQYQSGIRRLNRNLRRRASSNRRSSMLTAPCECILRDDIFPSFSSSYSFTRNAHLRLAGVAVCSG